MTLPHEVQHLRDSPLGTKSITWVEEYLGTKKAEEGLILSGRCAVDVWRVTCHNIHPLKGALAGPS